MRTIERRIEYEGRGTWFTFYNLTDIHGGSVHCAEKKLDKIIAEINDDPYAYWGEGGDPLEYITRSDPRHKESELAPWLHGIDDLATAQEEWLFEKLRPIAGKCLWVNSGNHESAIFRHTERNVYSNIVTFLKQAGGLQKERIGIGYRGFVRVRFHRPDHTNTLNIMAEHGWGGGRMKGGHVNKTTRIFGYFDCDLYFAGHAHQCHALPHTMATTRGDVVKFGCVSGTFRGNSVKVNEMDPGCYEDERGYNPTDVMGVRVRYNPDSKEMTATVFPY